jgi:hypothetical protein
LGGVAIAKDFAGPPWFSAAHCTRQDSDAADRDLDNLNSWIDLYQAFQRYRQCDDGSTAEGYSDATSKLLVRRWESLPELAKLGRAHPQFDRFVFRHIDETWNFDDGVAVADNARKRCPRGLNVLCRRLERAAMPAAALHR